MDASTPTDWLNRVAGLSAADMSRARKLAAQTGERLARALRRLGTASDSAIAQALAAECGLDIIEAKGFPDEPLEAGGVAIEFLTSTASLPVAETESDITLAVADPTDPAPADGVRLASGKTVTLVVAGFTDIETAQSRLYGLANKGLDAAAPGTDESDADNLKDLASEAAVVRLVSDILGDALARRASDVHVEPFRDHMRLRFRIDGVLQERPAPPQHLARPDPRDWPDRFRQDHHARRCPRLAECADPQAGLD